MNARRTMTVAILAAAVATAAQAQSGHPLRSRLVPLTSRMASATDLIKEETSSLGGRIWNRLDPDARRDVLARLDDHAEDLHDAADDLGDSELRRLFRIQRSRRDKELRFRREFQAMKSMLDDAEAELRRRGDKDLIALFRRDVQGPVNQIEQMMPQLAGATGDARGQRQRRM